MTTKTLLDAVTSAGAGDSHLIDRPSKATFQARLSGDGAVTASVAIEGCHDPAAGQWVNIATIDLTGTNSVNDGFWEDLAWGRVRGRVLSITGTDAALTLTMDV